MYGRAFAGTGKKGFAGDGDEGHEAEESLLHGATLSCPRSA